MTVNTDVVQDRIFRRVSAMIDGWNRAELCRKSGVPESTLATQISRSRFSFDVLLKLAPTLGTSVGDLIEPEADGIPDDLKGVVFDQLRQLVHWAEAMAARGDAAGAAQLAAQAAPLLSALRPGDEPPEESARPGGNGRAQSSGG